jgi:hypothetical protein
LNSVRDLERAIASLPPDYGQNVKEPEDVTDLTDYPRIAKIQSDLLLHAFASGQTRVDPAGVTLTTRDLHSSFANP